MIQCIHSHIVGRGADKKKSKLFRHRNYLERIKSAYMNDIRFNEMTAYLYDLK